MNPPSTLTEWRSDHWAGARTFTVSSAPAFPARRSDMDSAEKVEQTISYMMDHLDQPMQIAKLAAMACVSASHYFALFKRRTGRAPLDYFTRLRMARARSLLETTSQSVKEVAATLGYDDPFYFSRVFKSVNEVAPSFYRSQRVSQPTRAVTGQ